MTEIANKELHILNYVESYEIMCLSETWLEDKDNNKIENTVIVFVELNALIGKESGAIRDGVSSRNWEDNIENKGNIWAKVKVWTFSMAILKEMKREIIHS